eukprot:TRINITY_DN4914_c0_g2_i4.p1 TRINITY_DN4914_c0_g2~~TRINITY_DN4914_c0_g2_i4.p1  ORF type:complete len:598 (-),score=126.79 TRINITY_DN4914_c0_g2_i4:53-1846(-)
MSKIARGSEKASDTKPISILDGDRIKEHLKVPESETESSLLSTLAFLVFGVTFAVVVFLLFENQDQVNINRAIKNEFSLYDIPYTEVNDINNLYLWTLEFISYFLNGAYYPGGPDKIFPEISSTNNLISGVRMIQRRMKLVDGRSIFEEKDFKVWAGKGFDPTGPKSSDEATDTFCEVSKLCSDFCAVLGQTNYEDCNLEMVCVPENRICDHDSSLKVPGYIAWLDVLSEEDKELNLEFLLMRILYLAQWLSLQIRGLIVDFVLYNPYLQVYSYASITLEYSEYTHVSSKFRLEHFNKSYYTVNGLTVFRVICEILFAVSLISCLLLQPIEIYRTYKKVRSDLEDRAITTSKKLKKAHDQDEKIDFFDGVLNKLKLGFLVIYEHFSSLWNILDLLCIILSIIAVAYWFRFLVHQNSYVKDYNSTDPSSEIRKLNDNVLHACNILYACRHICALNLIFVLIRLLKCAMYFMPKLSLMFDALNRAKYHIFFFFIIAAAVLLAFVLFMFLCFGPNIETFSHFENSILALFKFMNYWYSPFEDISGYNAIISCIIFMIFVTVVSFVLLNMFVGFLHVSYKAAVEEKKKKSCLLYTSPSPRD